MNTERGGQRRRSRVVVGMHADVRDGVLLWPLQHIGTDAQAAPSICFSPSSMNTVLIRALILMVVAHLHSRRTYSITSAI